MEKLRESILVMEEYMRIRMAMRDWHGVMDAAADLRELESSLRTLEQVEVNQMLDCGGR
jgi:hypothetical protein